MWEKLFCIAKNTFELLFQVGAQWFEAQFIEYSSSDMSQMIPKFASV